MWLKLTQLSNYDFPTRVGYKYVNMNMVRYFSEYDLDTTFIELIADTGQNRFIIVQESADEIYAMLRGDNHETD